MLHLRQQIVWRKSGRKLEKSLILKVGAKQPNAPPSWDRQQFRSNIFGGKCNIWYKWSIIIRALLLNDKRSVDIKINRIDKSFFCLSLDLLLMSNWAFKRVQKMRHTIRAECVSLVRYPCQSRPFFFFIKHLYSISLIFCFWISTFLIFCQHMSKVPVLVYFFVPLLLLLHWER